ncbi:MAG: PaaI family thioesterase [Hyphomicrobiaceae bacterium]|jgi:uncharacterized protein (TIGR00369 family)
MSAASPVTNRLDASLIEALIDARFPQIHAGGRSLVIEEVGERNVCVRLQYHERHTRPGGTVSGVAMFMLADFAVYVAIIAALGDTGLDAVTTNLNINFLSRPEPRDLIARVRLIRLGRRLAVGEAQIYSDGSEELVAHAIATYALPAA